MSTLFVDLMSILVNGIIYLLLFLFLLDPPGDSQKDPMKWVYLSFCPSAHPSVCLGIFLELFFLNFVVLLETHMKLCMTAEFSRKRFFVPKIGKIALKWAKNRVFFNLLKNLIINFYWIYSVMKTFIICFVPTQIPYVGKMFQRFGPKCSQPIRLQDFLINHVSRTNQWNTNTHRLKVKQNFFEWALSEMGMASLVMGL